MNTPQKCKYINTDKERNYIDNNYSVGYQGLTFKPQEEKTVSLLSKTYIYSI